MLNDVNKFSRRFYSRLFINSLFLFIFGVSCAQKNNEHAQQDIGPVVKNKTLPKEIKLSPKTSKIIDSVFTFKNNRRQLQSVQLFDLKNGILISANRKYYQNDTLNQTTTDRFDGNGNNIESNTILHFKHSSQLFKRKLDEAGNLMELTSTEDGRKTILEFKNSYNNNNLVSVIITSKQSGDIIKKTFNKYDAKGNLLEELNNGLSGDADNFYQYNEASQVILHKHIQGGLLHDSIVYHYTNGLLDKETWYESQPANPMVTKYQYNEKKQLILVTEENFGNKTFYKNYDAFGNWQGKEQYWGAKISSLTKRIFIND